MKFGSVATLFLSLSLGAQARVEIAGVDPENYVSKEVDADVAAGGIRKLQDQGVLTFKNNGAKNKRKGYLRSLHEDDFSLDDDQLVTEEVLTIEYYQDNRFSSPDPVSANAEQADPAAPGNRWLYANVPLQPVFGINDLPIQGLAQGYCETLSEMGDGFCHFTYEFFEVNQGAIVVYASMTAEGTIAPQGLSTLNILGGTGEFAGAVGEIKLQPVGIDESIVPARIFPDGSFFMGNRNGYEAEFDVSIRYLINEPMPVPVPVQMPVPAPTASSASGFQLAAASISQRVTCQDQIESEYCDCNLDCESGSPRCGCPEAQDCCGFR